MVNKAHIVYNLDRVNKLKSIHIKTDIYPLLRVHVLDICNRLVVNHHIELPYQNL